MGMILTKEFVLKGMPSAGSRIDKWLMPLESAILKYEIDNPARISAFLAQIAHETRELFYTSEIASGAAYEGRKDLGNIKPGDGRKFKGRGPLQATGRDMYELIAKELGIDCVNHPELLEQPIYGALSSAFIWSKVKRLNPAADLNTEQGFLKISTRINGKNKQTGLPNGWSERLRYWELYKAA